MRSDRRRHRAIAAATFAALVLVLAAACSNNSTTATDKAPTTSAATSGSTPGNGPSGTAGSSSATTRAPATTVPPYTSEVYKDPKSWLCRPDAPNNICNDPQDATVVAADGKLTPEPFQKAKDPGIDCFYVYPTISSDKTINSDMEPSDPEFGTVRNQFARLGSVCRTFAPVYRQLTLGVIFGGAEGGDRAQAGEIAYGDVLDAWKQYLANDNKGRGVVLIGHSQGSGHLSKLIREQIDPNPDLRKQLVSAYLLGSSVTVPEGKDVGGDFKDVPLCREKTQTGCVVSYMSFRSTSPPPANSFFGRPRGNNGGVSACVNPAALEGGSAELHNYFPHSSPALTDPAADAKITTPFVSMPGLLTGECVTKDGFTYLEVTVHGDPSDPRVDDIKGDLTPEWGLHLVDVNLTMGDIVSLVQSQAKAYLGG